MNIKNRCRRENQHYRRNNHCGRGPSSYSMHDPQVIFNELNLKEGDSFLDLGCGAGDYSIQASKMLGESGRVYALDVMEDILKGLNKEAHSQGLTNIKTKLCDIKEQIDIDNQCIDVCFIATVLHSLGINEETVNLFLEIKRVLKPNGRMVIIECKKEETSFGPPISMRVGAEELEELVLHYGFEKTKYVDLGYNYMIQFAVK